VDALLRPFSFEFFRNGLIVATVAGALCGLVGTYVVLRGMSYLGHGLSHAIFGGFAVASLLGTNVIVGAGAWGAASALAIGRVARTRHIGSDAAVGVVTTASFALGLVALQLGGGAEQNPDAVLFGNVLGVSRTDVAVVTMTLLLTATIVFLRYRALLFVTFDPEVAAASGVRVARIDAMLMLLLAVAILVSMQVLGVTLVAAAIVVPAATARLLTVSFARMLLLATTLGAAGSAAGTVLSYHLDVATGPAIALTHGAVFVAGLLAARVRSSPLRGVDRLGDHRVLEHPDPLDLDANRVARNEVSGRIAERADTGGRAGRHEVARLERADRGEERDLVPHVVDHLVSRGVLHELAAHDRGEAQPVRVRELVGGHDPRAGRSVGVPRLAEGHRG
jgi:manganese/iron transport system permease protein/iron/zinc/copper transport system permease protein